MKLLLIPDGVIQKVPSSILTDTLPSLAATQPSCHILWHTSQMRSLISCSCITVTSSALLLPEKRFPSPDPERCFDSL